MRMSLAKPDVDRLQPRDTRLTTILLVARVSSEARDDLCRVRNISAGGMLIETLAPFDVGQRIDVELKNGVTMRSEVRWVKHPDAGVQFDKPVNIEHVLASCASSRKSGARATRSPRLSAQCPVTLRHEGRVQSAVLENISQGGAQLRSNLAIKIDDQVVLFVPGLEPRHAIVRWAHDDCMGFSFIEKLGFSGLAKWLAGPERFALAPAASVTRTDRSSVSAIRRPMPSRRPVRRKLSS
jgi:PilZ domain